MHQKDINWIQLQKNKIKQSTKKVDHPKDFWSFLQIIGNLSYDSDYAYLKFPLECALRGESLDFCKGSQIGATEAILNYSFFSLVESQKNIFYMLPTDSDCEDFSSARFNTIVNFNEDIAREFQADNVHHKKYKAANIYIRGANNSSKNKSKIKSVPVKILIMDELDEISEDSQLQVEERLSGSLDKQIIRISTPTLSDRGIWKATKNGKKFVYLLKCSCGFEQSLDFDLTVDLDAKEYKCQRCKRFWTHDEKRHMLKTGRWQQIQDGERIAVAISQLYSPTVMANELISRYLDADTDLKKQVFFNHKLGLPYTSEGSRISEDLVESRLGNVQDAGLNRVAGIDVGYGRHHVVVASWHDVGPIIIATFLATWEELKEKLLAYYDVKCVVIDANPERSESRKFVEAFGNGWMALYPNDLKLPFVQLEKEKYVNINRTEIIDNVLDRFRKDTICIQNNLSGTEQFQQYKKHMASVTRLYREKRGKVEAYYTESGADHYLHATVYMEIAGRIGGNVGFDGVSGSFIK